MKSKITIITPPIKVSEENYFNLTISNKNGHNRSSHKKDRFETKIHSYIDCKGYVIKDCELTEKDVIINEEILDALIEARYRKNVMDKVIKFCKKSSKIDDKILNDIDLLNQIVSKISTPIVFEDDIIEVCNQLHSIKNYQIT